MVSTRADSSLDGERLHLCRLRRGVLAQHSLAFPNFLSAALTVNIGWLGLQHLLAYGGTEYYGRRVLDALR